MPRSKPAALNVPQSPPLRTNLSTGSVDPLDRQTSPQGPTSDDGSSEADTPTISVPQSPASPRQASRSFWPGARVARQVMGRTQEDPQARLPSASSSSNTLQAPTFGPGRPVTPQDRSYGSLLESLSVSDRTPQTGALSDADSSDVSTLREQPDSSTQRRPSKHVFSQFVNRSRSAKPETNHRHSIRPVTRIPSDADNTENAFEAIPHTAPMDAERGYREMFRTLQRDKSADRAPPSSKDGSEQNFKPGSSYESGGLFSGFKGSTSKAPDSTSKPSKGWLGRFTRSGSAHDPRDAIEDGHQLQILKRPLEEQTRKTRIKRRIEDALDKTEYWLPALPYRAIEYLNEKASEEEGLYRVPGANRDIKYYQFRFDTDGDVNLLKETALFDPNIIGSMFKSWLRDLPETLLPKDVQARLVPELQNAKTVPQAMRDELSMLPPYNYYLLFAITCHIAILLSKADKNKMSYHNLCICFQPCLGIDGFCFYFLVCDWTNCWQGCWTEKEYYNREEEARVLENAPPSSAGQSSYLSDNGSRPPTGGDMSSSPPPIPERRRPSGVAYSSARSGRSVPARTTTPPELSPVEGVSPMRLPPDEEE